MTTLRILLGKLNGVLVSLLVHGAVAAVACVSLIRVSGGGSGGEAGQGNGIAAFPAFSAGFHHEEERLEGNPAPDVREFAPVSDDEPVEADLQKPLIPFDAFAIQERGETLPRSDASFTADPSTARFPADLRGARLPASASKGETGAIATGAQGTGSGLGARTGDGCGEGVGPVLVYSPQIPYPREARRQSIEGVVVVELRIHVDGSCAVNKVLQSSGLAALDEAVVGTVSTWKYKPAQEGGRPVTTVERIRFVFQLTK